MSHGNPFAKCCACLFVATFYALFKLFEALFLGCVMLCEDCQLDCKCKYIKCYAWFIGYLTIVATTALIFLFVVHSQAWYFLIAPTILCATIFAIILNIIQHKKQQQKLIENESKELEPQNYVIDGNFSTSTQQFNQNMVQMQNQITQISIPQNKIIS